MASLATGPERHRERLGKFRKQQADCLVVSNESTVSRLAVID